MTKMELGEAGILFTVLLILETIFLEAFSFEGEDYLGTILVMKVVVVVAGGSSSVFSSSSSRRIFCGIL
jgi:hypothetical protein